MALRVVIDGLPITGMSLGIVVENLLRGWVGLADPDDLHLVVTPQSPIRIPPEVEVHRVDLPAGGYLGRLWAQSWRVPQLCRALSADAMLGVLPTTTVAPLPCPRTIITYDLRHELRPEQFPPRARWLRTASYDVGFAQADAIACISERTRRDLLAAHPRLAGRPVGVTHLGADHVRTWPGRPLSGGYAVAFGQYANKNVDVVVEAWALLAADRPTLPLHVLGLAAEPRRALDELVGRRGLHGLVVTHPWLPDEEFQRWFSSADLVVFPSDFEGFGLPAVEAMALEIPVVISDEPALVEVTAGHATVMDGGGAGALARAVRRARATSPEALRAARVHADGFTWAGTASGIRELLHDAVESRRSRRARPRHPGAHQGSLHPDCDQCATSRRTSEGFRLQASYRTEHLGQGGSRSESAGATGADVADRGA